MARPKSKDKPDAETAPEQQAPPHIIVIPSQNEGGELEIAVNAAGISLLETPTILALAKVKVEEKLGI